MMATIPIKLNDTEVSKLDYLVKMGKYKSRNQAIRAFIESCLAQEPAFFNESTTDIEKIKTQLFKQWDVLPEFTFSLKNGKSLVDLVSQDRER